jgi:hypothetical protein
LREWQRWLRKALEVIHSEECGQNLIEFTFVAAVMALGAPAEMGPVAVHFSSVFLTLASKFLVASERDVPRGLRRAPIGPTGSQ